MAKLFRNPRYFYLILFLGLLFIVFSFRGSIKTARTGGDDIVSGWAWSENIGWISFNCSNPEIDSCATQDYGVDLNTTMNFSGWAWSENVGWIAFEDTVATPDGHAFASNCLNDCNVDFGNTCIACFNPNDWEVYGWAKVVALGDDGWINLNCANQDACDAAPQSDWYDTDWSYRKKITINAGQVASTESNFPVLIARNSDSDVASSARADGYDIIFTDSTGTSTIYFEREYYNSSTGEMHFWVKTDVSSTADTDIYMYYGNASQSTDLSSPDDVWDANFVLIQHLQEAPADEVAGHIDSSGDGYTGTPHNFAGGTSDWYNTSWDYRKKITINASQVASTESNFPVLIATTTDSHVAANARSDGYDIIFTDSTGISTIDFEREYYNSSTGEMYFWVEMDISSVTDTDIYMYYGSSTQSIDYSAPTDVWDANFVLIQHLQEAPADEVAGHIDSSGDGYTGTPHNFAAGGGSTDATAKIDGADDLDGTNDYVSMSLPTVLYDIPTQDFTISFWMYPHDVSGQGTWIRILEARENSSNAVQFVIHDSNGELQFMVEDAGIQREEGVNTPITANDYYYVVGTWDWDTNTVNLYLDGSAQSGSFGTGHGLGDQTAIHLGRRTNGSADTHYDGLMDEFRVSNTIRTAGWIQNEYNNQDDPSTFLNFNSVEQQGSSGGGSTDATCRIDGADDLDGTDDYVSMSLPTVLYDIPTQDFTISFWMYPHDVSGQGTWIRILEAREDSSNAVQFVINDSNGELQFMVEDAGTQREEGVNTPITANDYYYVVGTWDASINTVNLYLDGSAQSGSFGTGHGLGDQTAIHLGRRTNGSADTHYDGLMDEFRVSNTIRTAGWIQNEYSNQNDPSAFLTFNSEEGQGSGEGIDYSVYVSNGEFRGWGWNNNAGDTGIGWISFNCLDTDVCATSDYKVELSINFPEVINLSAPNWSTSNACGVFGAKQAYLEWTFDDEDPGDIQQYYHIIVNTSDSTSSPLIDTGKTTSSAEQYLVPSADLTYDDYYYWWVRVWDSFGFASPWVQFDTGAGHTLTDNVARNNAISPDPDLTFTTYMHEFPLIDFTYVPPEILKGEVATFTSISSFYSTSSPDTPTSCDASNCSWLWGGEGIESISATTSSSTNMVFKYSLDPSVSSSSVTIEVADNDNYACSSSTSLFIDLLPIWKETKPLEIVE